MRYLEPKIGDLSSQHVLIVCVLVNRLVLIMSRCNSGDLLYYVLSLCFRRLEWSNFEATVTESKKIMVRNVLNEGFDKLDFRDRVIKASLSFNHLVVATAAQCYIYRYSILYKWCKIKHFEGLFTCSILLSLLMCWVFIVTFYYSVLHSFNSCIFVLFLKVIIKE